MVGLKNGVAHEGQEMEFEVFEQDHEEIERVDTININNYHGITATLILAFIAVCAVGFGQLLNLVGAGFFASSIAAAVGGASKTAWLTQAIAIVSGVLAAPISQAADFWGRKWFIVTSCLAAVAGSLVVSRANSINMAIAGQALNGITMGASPLLYTIASEILPRRFRPAAQGLLNGSLGLGAIASVLGGSALERASRNGFRTYWYICAGIMAFAAFTLTVAYNPPPRDQQRMLSTEQKLKSLDWVGCTLLSVGVILFTVALSWSQNPYPWTDAHVLAPFLIGTAFMIALGAHQWKFKTDGIFDHRLFKKDRNFALALLCFGLDGMVFFAVTNYYPFEAAVLYETDPFRIGLRMSIVFFGSLLGSLIIAAYSSFTKTVRGPIVAAFALFTAFSVAMSTTKLSSSTATFCYPVLVGLGLGFGLPCIVTAAQLSTPPAMIAITGGLLCAVRAIGGSIGLAVYTSVLSSGVSKHLAKDIATAVLPLGLSAQELPSFISAILAADDAKLMSIPGVTVEIIHAGVAGMQKGYLTSFHYVWITAACLSAVGVIAACFIINPKDDYTMHVDAPLQEKDVRGNPVEAQL